MAVLEVMLQHAHALFHYQLILKSKLNISLQKDALLSPNELLFGMEEPLTKQLSTFIELILSAIEHLFILPELRLS